MVPLILDKIEDNFEEAFLVLYTNIFRKGFRGRPSPKVGGAIAQARYFKCAGHRYGLGRNPDVLR